MYEEYGTEFDYFSRLDLTLLTLFQLMTLDGSGVAREVVGIYTWAWVPIILFIILTGIFVTNMVIAIICDSVLEISSQEEEDRARDRLDEKTSRILAGTLELKSEIERKAGVNCGSLSQPDQNSSHRSGYMNSNLFHEESEQSEDDDSSFSLNLRPGGIRERCGKFVNSKPVNTFIITLIIINSILMAIGTFSFVKDDPPTLAAFDTVDTVFLCIYSVESFLQVVYHGIYIYKDGWASFDLFLVVLSWSFSFTNIPVQAARSLRIVRILRLVPKLKSLKIIITAIFSVVPKLGGITVILLLIFYIFAIILTMLYKDYELEEDYFTRLDTTMFTLFQIMTMADWSPIVRELMVDAMWAPLPIILFLVVSGFIFLNLIVAFVCEAMNIVEAMNEEKKTEVDQSMKKSIRVITNNQRLVQIDETQNEILKILELYDLVPKDGRIDQTNNPTPQSFEHSRNQSLLDLDEFLDANSYADDSLLSESTGKNK